MRYKYFTWTDDGYFQCQQLLSEEQIRSLLPFIHTQSEVFATIQDYTETGETVGCPLFFDIDAESLADAHEEMINLVENIRCEYDVDPLVYFSGGKGFHVIAPLYIRHKRCHEIAKMIADELKVECDPAVYRTRSMFRCNNTWNEKGRRFKVNIRQELKLQRVLQMAGNNHDRIKTPAFPVADMDISEYVAKLPDREEVFTGSGKNVTMPPCIKRLWDLDKPPSGHAHQLAHIMARYCLINGLDKHDTMGIFSKHHFWSTVKARDYEKVIESVYRVGTARIGCKTGRDSELLTQYCHLVCQFNDDFKIENVLRRE